MKSAIFLWALVAYFDGGYDGGAIVIEGFTAKEACLAAANTPIDGPRDDWDVGQSIAVKADWYVCVPVK